MYYLIDKYNQIFNKLKVNYIKFFTNILTVNISNKSIIRANMSKSSFEAAMVSAGFNDSTTKISKTKLKAVMNEISDGIWGGLLIPCLR